MYGGFEGVPYLGCHDPERLPSELIIADWISTFRMGKNSWLSERLSSLGIMAGGN